MGRRKANGNMPTLTTGDLVDLVRAHKSRDAAVALVDAYVARMLAEVALVHHLVGVAQDDLPRLTRRRATPAAPEPEKTAL